MSTKPDIHTVITGMGLASPWGIGPAAVVLSAPPSDEPTRDGDGAWRIPDPILRPNAKRVPDLGGDRTALLAEPAISAALQEAAFDMAAADPTRVGLVLGTSYAALADMLRFATEVKQQTPRFVSPLHFPQTVGNYAAGAVARALKINGPNITLGGGSRSGLAAVAEAVRLLNGGKADLIIAGGADAVSPSLLRAMMDADQADPNGPFASQPAEGACFFCLESESSAITRGANTMARITIPVEPPPSLLISGHFIGRLDQDRNEMNTLHELVRPAETALFLSARHQLANAFAASGAAQLALAAVALRRRSAPILHPEETVTDGPIKPHNEIPPGFTAALVVSAPDRNGRRTILRIESSAS
jgi:3-oxoacyl-(acyl-carrier-protein) synthase